jgi:DNA-directed RNA polymerase specialized sigma subunit
MKPVIKVDHLVIAQVIGLVRLNRGEPDFRENVVFLELRYLHYQRLAKIKGLTVIAFNERIQNVLVSDLQAHLASAFELTSEEDATLIKQMHGKYHFLAQATLEEHNAAGKLIKALPDFDQQVMALFRDGLGQTEIAEALGMRVRDVAAVSTRVKAIYRQVRMK